MVALVAEPGTVVTAVGGLVLIKYVRTAWPATARGGCQVSVACVPAEFKVPARS